MDRVILVIGDIIIPGITLVLCFFFLTSGITVTDVNGVTKENVGIYEALGTVSTKEEADDNIHNTPDFVEESVTADAPVVKYNNQVIHTWDAVSLKNLFSVEIDGNTFIGSMEEEGQFTITLTGITNKSGTSVLTIADKDITEEEENFTVIALYNTSDETIMFTEPGLYKIKILVKDAYGGKADVSVSIPVEYSATS